MTQAEFEAIVADASKRIDGNILWSEDEDHSPAVEFRAEVISAPGYPLFTRGSYNREARKLSYVLIHRGEGRIYGLCLGTDHHNPPCDYVGERHKHRWSESLRDKEAYVPADITVGANDLHAAWQQFCSEARIIHNGVLHLSLEILEGQRIF